MEQKSETTCHPVSCPNTSEISMLLRLLLTLGPAYLVLEYLDPSFLEIEIEFANHLLESLQKNGNHHIRNPSIFTQMGMHLQYVVEELATGGLRMYMNEGLDLPRDISFSDFVLRVIHTGYFLDEGARTTNPIKLLRRPEEYSPIDYYACRTFVCEACNKCKSALLEKLPVDEEGFYINHDRLFLGFAKKDQCLYFTMMLDVAQMQEKSTTVSIDTLAAIIAHNRGDFYKSCETLFNPLERVNVCHGDQPSVCTSPMTLWDKVAIAIGLEKSC